VGVRTYSAKTSGFPTAWQAHARAFGADPTSILPCEQGRRPYALSDMPATRFGTNARWLLSLCTGGDRMRTGTSGDVPAVTRSGSSSCVQGEAGWGSGPTARKLATCRHPTRAVPLFTHCHHGECRPSKHAGTRYIVDLVRVDARLVIEFDGGQHADAVAYDSRRTARRGAPGLCIGRYWNHDVLERTSAVLEDILRRLSDSDGVRRGDPWPWHRRPPT